MSESNTIPSNSTNVSAPAAAPPKKTKRGPRGGVYDPFPMKVHRMLAQSKLEGRESIVSWLPHGRAFKIHQPKVFAEMIMPRFFNQSKYTSFQRQLNLYGFNRSTRGSDQGSYYHDLFLRGKPSLATRLFRQKVKGSGHKTLKLVDREPDFYSMPPLVEDSHDESLIPNVFAGDKYLPVTAVAPITQRAQVMVPLVHPVSVAKRPNMLVSSPRTVSSSSDSDTDESHHDVTGLQPQDAPVSRQAHAPPVRLVSSRESITEASIQNNSSFVNELNETIFMHELAMGCSILCQLRRGESNL